MPRPPYIETQRSKELRPIIRETLALSPDRKWTLIALHAFLRGNGFSDAKESDVNAALLWNEKRGNVTFEYNPDTELDEWQITERGKDA